MSEDLSSILRRVQTGELTPDEALPLIDSLSPAASAAGAANPVTHSATSPGPGPSFGAGPGPEVSNPAAGSSAPGSPFGTPDSLPPQRGSIEDDAPTSKTSGPRPSPSPGGTTGAPGPDFTQEVDRIKVIGSYRNITIVGDPTVAQVHVSGVHNVRRDGGAYVIEATNIPTLSMNTEHGAPSSVDDPNTVHFSFRGVTRSFSWNQGTHEHTLMVRVNPDLPLEVDATASKVRIAACEAGLRARVTAVGLKLERIRGAIDIQAMSSSVKGHISISGPSRLGCEASSAKLTIDPDASLHVTGYNRAGTVTLPGAVSKSGLDGTTIDATMGSGHHQLVIEASMSSINIHGPEATTAWSNQGAE